MVIVNLKTTLEFFRGLNTSVSLDMKTAFDQWVAEQRSAGLVDEALVSAVDHDLEVHHRLTPETLIGAPHAPYASLNHTEDQHFGR